MNRIDMEGRVAVVTGGVQGIGRAVAERLAASGATVATWDVQGGADVVCDVADEASVAAALADTERRFGPVDCLVNSAGIAGPNAPVAEYPLADWEAILRVNLTGTFLVNRAVAPGMAARGYGRICNVASVAGKEGNPNAAAYSASKAGVIALTKSLGKELAGVDVGVNCVAPAAARTPIFEQMSAEHVAYMLSKIPRGRFVEVDEVAAMIAWVVSEENRFTTGAVFDLSGGRATY